MKFKASADEIKTAFQKLIPEVATYQKLQINAQKEIDRSANQANKAALSAQKEAEKAIKEAIKNQKLLDSEIKKANADQKKSEQEKQKAADKAIKDAIKNQKLLDAEIKKANAEQKKAEQEAHKRAQDRIQMFKDIAGLTKNISWNLATGAISLAKWAAIGALTSGFGIGALASSAASNSKEAKGMGVSTGVVQAAKNSYGTRFLDDPSSTLQTISEAQSDFKLRPYLENLVGRKLSSESPAKILPVLENVIARMSKVSGYNAQYAKTYGLDIFNNLQERHRLGDNLEETRKAGETFSREAKEFQVPDSTNKNYSKLVETFKKSGILIENSLIKSLVKLTPQLDKLSMTISTDITKFLGSKNFDNLLDSFVLNFKKLNDYISSGQFTDNLKTLGCAVLELANGINKVAGFFFGKTTGEKAIDESHKNNTDLKSMLNGTYGSLSNEQLKSSKEGMSVLMSQGYTSAQSAGILGNFIQESSLNPSSLNSRGMYGIAQWSKHRQADYESWAKKTGHPTMRKSSLRDQLLFHVNELKYGGERAAGMEISRAATVDQAALGEYHAERPGMFDFSLNRRKYYGKQIYDTNVMYNAQVPAPYLVNQQKVQVTTRYNTGADVTSSIQALTGSSY
jgi:hypothetical protein